MSVRSVSRLFAHFETPAPTCCATLLWRPCTFVTPPLFPATRQNPVQILSLFQDTVCRERTAAQQTIPEVMLQEV